MVGRNESGVRGTTASPICQRSSLHFSLPPTGHCVMGLIRAFLRLGQIPKQYFGLRGQGRPCLMNKLRAVLILKRAGPLGQL